MGEEMDRVYELAAKLLVQNAHYQGIVADRAAREVALVMAKDEKFVDKVIAAVLEKGVNGAQQKVDAMTKSAVERMVSQNIGPTVAALSKKFTAKLLEEPKEPGNVPDTDWVSHPGETLKDWFEEHPEDDPFDLGWGGDIVSGILSGNPAFAVGPRAAEQLERRGCGTKEFWLRREALYRAKLAGL